MIRTQPQAQTDNTKQFLGGSRGRLLCLFIGLVVALGGGAYVIYTQLVLSRWKETGIISVTDTKRGCRGGGRTHGTWQELTYVVNDVRYTKEECITKSLGATTISYNPDNPSESIINTITVQQWIAIGITVLGAVVTLGSIFASDTHGTENWG